MTDIVDRLRDIADEWFNPLDGIHESINQGADEIERLRFVLRYMVENPDQEHKLHQMARAALGEEE